MEVELSDRIIEYLLSQHNLHAVEFLEALNLVNNLFKKFKKEKGFLAGMYMTICMNDEGFTEQGVINYIKKTVGHLPECSHEYVQTALGMALFEAIKKEAGLI